MNTKTGVEVASRDEKRKKAYKPVWHVLQGLFIIGIGMLLLVLNLGSSYKTTTGHIQGVFDQAVSVQYSISYLQISTAPNDLFLFDKRALHPAWTDQFAQNTRVDVYYSDGTPKHVVALQMYDLAGSPTTKFTTTDYTRSQSASPLSNIGLDGGVLLVLLGGLWAGMGGFKFVRSRQQRV